MMQNSIKVGKLHLDQIEKAKQPRKKDRKRAEEIDSQILAAGTLAPV